MLLPLPESVGDPYHVKPRWKATRIENATLHERMNISLTGTAQNNAIGDFKVTSVEAERF
jgi:hypothetical protein